jgi:hypothetical protein
LRNSGRPVEPENRRSTSRTPNKGRVHVNIFLNCFDFPPTKSSLETYTDKFIKKKLQFVLSLPCATHEETKNKNKYTKKTCAVALDRFRKCAKTCMLNFLNTFSLLGTESGYVWAPLPTPPVDITGYVWAPLPQAN